MLMQEAEKEHLKKGGTPSKMTSVPTPTMTKIHTPKVYFGTFYKNLMLTDFVSLIIQVSFADIIIIYIRHHIKTNP